MSMNTTRICAYVGIPMFDAQRIVGAGQTRHFYHLNRPTHEMYFQENILEDDETNYSRGALSRRQPLAQTRRDGVRGSRFQ